MIAAKGTLTRQLVTRTAILVGAVAVAMSLVITLITTHVLTDQLDRQVDAALALAQSGGRGNSQRPGAGPGIPPGTIIVQQISTSPDSSGRIPVYAWRTDFGRWDALDDDTMQQLVTVKTDRGRKVTVTLDIGQYRVASTQRDGLMTVVGLPMSDLHRTTSTLIISELVLGLVAVIGSILISSALVRRTIRPLNRLADAAREVSQLELGRGEVDLPVRVDTSALHPNNEITQVGASFNHMLNNVEEALAARQASEVKVRQFVADASHELRNPLAAIRGYTELTQKHAGDLGPDTNYALSRIDAESARMAKLVNDLLLLARLDNDQPLEASPVDVTEIVLNAVSDARADSPYRTWKLNVPDEPALVRGDAHRLHQVLSNLLSNARTHTPPGTVVSTKVERDGDTVVLRVIDNGPGISPEAQQTVFERFVRGDSARAHSTAESTGLGLAIVSAVVNAHSGRVWLTSRPGHTEFSVALPAL